MPTQKATADCGATFAHDQHVYKTQRGKIKVCDGSITKRNSTPNRKV